jgi:hypothetical protein
MIDIPHVMTESWAPSLTSTWSTYICVFKVVQRQQSLHHVQLTQILAGDVIPQRKKYQDAASRVLHLVQNYGNRHVLDFLRGVAYNIHM